jgi:hypothetical protein
VFGWDPNYPWYAGLGEIVEYDWAAAYATVDTESLLGLLPQIRTVGIRKVIPSPNQ